MKKILFVILALALFIMPAYSQFGSSPVNKFHVVTDTTGQDKSEGKCYYYNGTAYIGNGTYLNKVGFQDSVFVYMITDSLKVNEGAAFGYDGGHNAWFFQGATTGENPYIYLYGYSTTHAGLKYGRINVSPEGNMIIRAEVAGYLGGDGQSTYLFDNMGGAFVDDKRLRWGSDNDAISVYDETTNDAMLFGIPLSSKRGLIFTHADTIDGDFTSLIATTNFPDVHFTDFDIDKKIKVGWIADDRPEITADTTLDIQSSGDQDLHIFGNSGAGENPILKVWGDESGTPTFFSISVEASGNTDLNAEGNIEFGGQGTQIGQFSNKWIQMLDQRGIAFGSDSQGDVRFFWDDSVHGSGTNEALLMGMDTSRGIIFGQHDLMSGNGGNAYDLTSLFTERFEQASFIWLDNDRDSYLQIYHSTDDLPTIRSNNSINMINATSPQAVFSGWDDVEGAAAASGSIHIGNNATLRGQLHYDGEVSGIFYIDNTYNHGDGDIRFRTETAGTVKNALTLSPGNKAGFGTKTPQGNLQVSDSDPHGGLVLNTYYATATITANATITAQVNVPTGAKIMGAQLHVHTALAAGETWDAVYITGATQSIGTNQAVAQNTNLSTHFDVNAATNIASGEVDVTIEKNSDPGVDVFTAQGLIEVIVYAYVSDTWDNE